jgi:hypothetical protein
MQAQTQFSPEQMILAARRAEGQGQHAYALQFYRYIADHFGATTEAYEAREAIYRLTQPVDPGQPVGYQQAQPVQHAPAPAAASMTDVRPSLDTGGGPSGGGPNSGRPSKRKPRKAQIEPEIDDSPAYDSGPKHRIGRFVAMMLGTMGWLMLLASLVAIPLIGAAMTVKSMPKGLREAIMGNLIAAGGITFGMLFLGLLAIFAAQTARATFDTADAVRHLLAQRGQE